MLTSAITTTQLALLHHTLGVNPERREPYRNHFVAGRGHHDMPDLEALEVAGLMERGHVPGFLSDSSIVFYTTESGRAYALENLPAAPPPKKRTRYEAYLDADGCAGDSFAEFLCGDRLPKFESRQAYGNGPRDRYGYEYRMYRRQSYPYDYRRDIEGDWAPTMKAAKASYKAALKARRAATLHTNNHNKEYA
ncbi:hypothetical protein [Cupriavidus pinatubonensis]|uniref:Uncharacterized protein n=1 Tax=Cupriavidus pinatubonensis TaxID=248026 RepID=A0ABN7YCA7_9BURK|nr:hypothetical protein [Cupriavidus pinatubonensis]CAG9169807.1 hypothetical protein LMG23994_01673 [Cupriavidus pinatubonensis]